MNKYKDFYVPGAVVVGSIVIALAIVVVGGIPQRGGTTASVVANQTPGTQTTGNTHQGSVVSVAVSESDHIRGNPNAPITLIEFSDLECPFCKRFHSTALQALDEFPGQVRWVYKHFPLDAIHPKADKEAEAAECAGELGGNDAFWRYADKIFEITPSNNNLDLAVLPQIAEDMGLDRAAFTACLDSGKYAQHVEDDYQQGLRAGVRGTPGSFVNGVPVIGAVPYEQLRSIIQSQLQ